MTLETSQRQLQSTDGSNDENQNQDPPRRANIKFWVLLVARVKSIVLANYWLIKYGYFFAGISTNQVKNPHFQGGGGKDGILTRFIEVYVFFKV